MSRLALAMVVASLLSVAGCDKTKRLSYVERDHYQALKVFMNDDQRKEFLKRKTEDERNAYLRKVGLWDAYYKFDERKRKDILAGDVKIGWEESALNMAWGRPHGKNLVAGRKAEQSYELKYRFEMDPYGDIVVWTPKSKTEHKAVLLYQVQVILDDGVISKMVRTDCVPNWNYCDKIKWTKGE